MVRSAVVGDADAIGFVHVESWQAAYRGLIADETLDNLSAAERSARWRRRLMEGHDSDDIWVAERAGVVVGFSVTGPTRDEGEPPATGEVMAIYAHSDHWGNGVGRELMEHAVAQLTEQKYERATLWVLRGNGRARRFYEAAGWMPDGHAKVEDGPDGAVFDEVRYAINLKGS